MDIKLARLRVAFTARAAPLCSPRLVDRKSILTGNEDEVAYIWDIAGVPGTAGWGREVRSFTGHTAGVVDVAFSHDGKRVLTGSGDGTARLWYADYHESIRYLCGILTRDLTEEERAHFDIAGGGATCSGSK